LFYMFWVMKLIVRNCVMFLALKLYMARL
jgi:hypothetical protein